MTAGTLVANLPLGVEWHRVFRRTGMAVGFLGALWLALSHPGVDGHAYWTMNPADPYGARVGTPDAFLYSPVTAFVLGPFTLLPWPLFHVLLAVLTAAALVYLVGPWSALALLFPPVIVELWSLNIHLLLAAAIVIGLRYPAAWSFVLLTKVTPGVGLLWFAVRREWRKLAAAIVATALLVGVSFALAPSLWFDWLATLRQGSEWHVDQIVALDWPLSLRLVVAAVIVSVGAWRNWRWAVVVAATVALPVVWVNGLAMLVAAIRLRSPSHSDLGDVAVVRTR